MPYQQAALQGRNLHQVHAWLDQAANGGHYHLFDGVPTGKGTSDRQILSCWPRSELNELDTRTVGEAISLTGC